MSTGTSHPLGTLHGHRSFLHPPYNIYMLSGLFSHTSLATPALLIFCTQLHVPKTHLLLSNHIMTMAIPVTQQPSHPQQNEDYQYVEKTLISRFADWSCYQSYILFGISILLLQANCYKWALTMGIPVSPQPIIPLENRRARRC